MLRELVAAVALVLLPLVITSLVLGLLIAGFLLLDKSLLPVVFVLVGISVFAVSSVLRLGREYLAPAAKSDPAVTAALGGLLIGSFLPLWENPFSDLQPQATWWQALCFMGGVIVAVIGLTYSGRQKVKGSDPPPSLSTR